MTRRVFKNTLLVSALSFAFVNAASASAPLLQDGKSSLYQRVLTTPSCVLKKSASDKDGERVDAFSRFYVYKNEGNYLTVGPDTTGRISGVLPKDCTVEWKMQTSLMFTNPANRNRAPIFKSKDNLQKIVDSTDIKKDAEAVIKAAVNGQADYGLISVEPEHYVDYKKNFYLLPILDFEETMFDDGNYVRELKIASVTSDNSKKSVTDTNAIKTFKAAVVFVIDSSISMQPYIDRTKKAINTIVEKIKKEKLESSVHFGLVSFRSNTKAVPKLEYTSKMYVKPGEAITSDDFSKKLATLSQAKVSSTYFDEDAYAGINTALEETDWSEYGGRYIVLVTDAGAIKGKDKLSSTGLDSKELRLEASHKGVAIYALHLLTPAASKNKDHARSQYQDLTYNSTISKSLYYPVNAGDVDNFGRKIDELSESITNQVKLASLGKDALGVSADSLDNSENAAMKADTIKIGYAMQLAYLGSKLGTTSPDFLTGWIADRDLVNHNLATSTPVVLLTKDELSALRDVTKKILDSANAGLLQSDDMFSQLRSVAVSLGRDPSSVASDKTLKLGELGLLGEYLDGLPYKSRIQELDEESWNSMGPDEQNRTIEDLENKLNYYQQCNDDASRWIKLNKDGDSGEAVYPVPLEILP
ncbi:MAG: vWA domain-containing protein [Succinivibrio sp.]